MGRLFEVIHQTGNAQSSEQGGLGAGSRPERPTLFSPAPSVRLELLRLVQELFLTRVHLSVRVVLFIATDERTDSAPVCTYAADTLASRIAGSVCLVDANYRSADVASLFKLSNEPGLTDILRGRSVHEVVHQIGGSNLWVLTAGRSFPDGPEGIGAESAGSRMEDICRQFEYLLVAAPPLLPYIEAAALGRLVDGAVLVLSASITRRHAARKAKERLHALGIPVLGAVLAVDTAEIPEILTSLIE